MATNPFVSVLLRGEFIKNKNQNNSFFSICVLLKSMISVSSHLIILSITQIEIILLVEIYAQATHYTQVSAWSSV